MYLLLNPFFLTHEINSSNCNVDNIKESVSFRNHKINFTLADLFVVPNFILC
jgi:hypothetical protein